MNTPKRDFGEIVKDISNIQDKVLDEAEILKNELKEKIADFDKTVLALETSLIEGYQNIKKAKDARSKMIYILDELDKSIALQKEPMK